MGSAPGFGRPSDTAEEFTPDESLRPGHDPGETFLSRAHHHDGRQQTRVVFSPAACNPHLCHCAYLRRHGGNWVASVSQPGWLRFGEPMAELVVSPRHAIAHRRALVGDGGSGLHRQRSDGGGAEPASFAVAPIEAVAVDRWSHDRVSFGGSRPCFGWGGARRRRRQCLGQPGGARRCRPYEPVRRLFHRSPLSVIRNFGP